MDGLDSKRKGVEEDEAKEVDWGDKLGNSGPKNNAGTVVSVKQEARVEDDSKVGSKGEVKNQDLFPKMVEEVGEERERLEDRVTSNLRMEGELKCCQDKR